MAVALCGALSTGCVPAQTGAALQAADDFQSVVAAENWPAACDHLSEEARSGLELTTARTCADALSVLRLPGDPAREAQVWGRNALVDVGAGAVFLSQFEDGWRVIAAGCTSRGEDLPYECKVRG
jgi:hypothetical protein